MSGQASECGRERLESALQCGDSYPVPYTPHPHPSPPAHSVIQMLASAFVASWSGVIRFHGLRPRPRPGEPAGVFVANHSSMIDFILLLQSHPYAVVGQKHVGWVGFLQDTLLSSLNCVWFDRGEGKDKKAAAERLRAHVRDPANAITPALLFPEGTCVNNEYVVQFKKFVFELGVPINPIAIKYNKVFVDAYWNSRQESFSAHLYRLMTSWAVVVDVWFLDPQVRMVPHGGSASPRRGNQSLTACALPFPPSPFSIAYPGRPG